MHRALGNAVYLSGGAHRRPVLNNVVREFNRTLFRLSFHRSPPLNGFCYSLCRMSDKYVIGKARTFFLPLR